MYQSRSYHQPKAVPQRVRYQTVMMPQNTAKVKNQSERASPSRFAKKPLNRDPPRQTTKPIKANTPYVTLGIANASREKINENTNKKINSIKLTRPFLVSIRHCSFSVLNLFEA